MARITATDGPQEGDLVVASVTTVKQNGCYVSLDEFDGREGFIFIGEIASGWVRNIRAHVREGQRLICKITGMRRDGTSYELSLKSVSDERRRDRLQQWKNEQRAIQLFVTWRSSVATKSSRLHGSLMRRSLPTSPPTPKASLTTPCSAHMPHGTTCPTRHTATSIRSRGSIVSPTSKIWVSAGWSKTRL